MTDDPNYIPRTDVVPGWGNVTYCDHEISDSFHKICSYSAIITLPIDCVGIYFIVNKTPKEMGIYKWFLLGHQICILLLDVYITLLVIPEFIFPIWGCKIHGFVNFIGVPAWFSGSIGLAQLGTSVTALFYYRTQIILPACHFLSHSERSKKIFYSINFVVNTLLPAHYMAFMPTDHQSAAKFEWFTKRVCVQQIFFDSNTYVLWFGPEKYYFYFLLYYMLITITIFAILVIVPIFYLIQKAEYMSEATRRAQKLVFFALCIQVLVPFGLGIVPVLVYLHVRHWYFERHAVNNWMLIIEGIHGSSETILMLLVTKPYRQAILRGKRSVVHNFLANHSTSVNTNS